MRCSGAGPVQVTAALLHDLGHFLIDEHNEESAFLLQDFLHEKVGAEYLEPFFIAAVTEPVKLHVPAKRYICTVDEAYYATLSEASKQSFQLQGGFMSAAEKAKILLLRWSMPVPSEATEFSPSGWPHQPGCGTNRRPMRLDLPRHRFHSRSGYAAWR